MHEYQQVDVFGFGHVDSAESYPMVYLPKPEAGKWEGLDVR
jgi:hypothetical protein